MRQVSHKSASIYGISLSLTTLITVHCRCLLLSSHVSGGFFLNESRSPFRHPILSLRYSELIKQVSLVQLSSRFFSVCFTITVVMSTSQTTVNPLPANAMIHLVPVKLTSTDYLCGSFSLIRCLCVLTSPTSLTAPHQNQRPPLVSRQPTS